MTMMASESGSTSRTPVSDASTPAMTASTVSDSTVRCTSPDSIAPAISSSPTNARASPKPIVMDGSPRSRCES